MATTETITIDIPPSTATTTTNLPKQQRAAVRQGNGETAKPIVQQIDVPQPGPGQILVQITWTGLCGSDKSLLQDEWAGAGVAMLPQTLGIAGHEGAGRVVAIGPGMEHRWKIGDRAGIKWIASVCHECEFCLNNGQDEVHCIKQLNSGFSAPGTFQEYCLTDGRYASRLPDGVKDEEAGPIMCGGVTAYVACKR
jgi:propanol-preferring alcohol dehydrogenase